MSERPQWDSQFRETPREQAARWAARRKARTAAGLCWQCAKQVADCTCPNIKRPTPEDSA
jgi:hypothetical protein